MTRERNRFIEKAQAAGYKKEIAENVFDLIERFAGYGFNKAHSTCYAMIAYQTAYLKAHWPVEFMAALLTAETEGSSGPVKEEKIALAVEECRRMGIKVLPPDISQSKVGFTIEDDANSLNGRAVRFGLSAIKNVGEAAIKVILDSREVGGEFKSLMDFCQRVDQQKVNKRVLESLIKAGAMDKFGKRAPMLSGLDKIRAKGVISQRQQANGQESLFENPTSLGEDSLPDMEEFTRQELLSLEKDLLGFYLTEHPLTPILSVLASQRSHRIYDLRQIEKKGQPVKIGGVVTGLRIVLTRNQAQEMAFAKIEDDSGSIEAVVFPKVFLKTRECWVKDRIILVKGRIELREETQNLVVEDASPLEASEENVSAKDKSAAGWDFEVKIPSQMSPRKLVELNKLLKQNQGKDKVALLFVDNLGRARRMVLPFGIDYNENLRKKIKEIIGE